MSDDGPRYQTDPRANDRGLHVDFYHRVQPSHAPLLGLARNGSAILNGIVTFLEGEPFLEPVQCLARSFLPDATTPAVWLVRRSNGDVYVCPAGFVSGDHSPALPSSQFRGAFCYSSDPTFRQIAGFDAGIRVHDLLI